MQARAFTVVSITKNGQSRLSRVGLTSLNNISGLWSIRTVLSCLIPGPGVRGPTCESSVKEFIVLDPIVSLPGKVQEVNLATQCH